MRRPLISQPGVSHHVAMRYRAPDTLTEAEQRRFLEVTAQAANPRDHVIFSMALGTGLRLSELLALNVGDIYERRAA